jgi:hypothetical protein
LDRPLRGDGVLKNTPPCTVRGRNEKNLDHRLVGSEMDDANVFNPAADS